MECERLSFSHPPPPRHLAGFMRIDKGHFGRLWWRRVVAGALTDRMLDGRPCGGWRRPVGVRVWSSALTGDACH